VDFFKHALN